MQVLLPDGRKFILRIHHCTAPSNKLHARHTKIDLFHDDGSGVPTARLSGVAFCNPKDSFNRRAGIGLALDRLCKAANFTVAERDMIFKRICPFEPKSSQGLAPKLVPTSEEIAARQADREAVAKSRQLRREQRAEARLRRQEKERLAQSKFETLDEKLESLATRATKNGWTNPDGSPITKENMRVVLSYAMHNAARPI